MDRVSRCQSFSILRHCLDKNQTTFELNRKQNTKHLNASKPCSSNKLEGLACYKKQSKKTKKEGFNYFAVTISI